MRPAGCSGNCRVPADAPADYGGLLAAGILVSVLDAASGGRQAFRSLAENLVPGGGAVNLVAAVATSLGLAREDPAPVYGACVTLFLTIVALVVLLMLIHAAIDQMRPESVMRSIHELALEARESELHLLGSTKAQRTSSPGTRGRKMHVLGSGYVVTIDVSRLARVVRSVGNEAEILIEGRLGEYLVFNDVVAHLVGVDPDDDSYDADVLAAFSIDDVRDVDAESGYAPDRLENIAWATGTSAGQSPSTAISAVRFLSDLLGRWLISGERDRLDRGTARGAPGRLYGPCRSPGTDGAFEPGGGQRRIPPGSDLCRIDPVLCQACAAPARERQGRFLQGPGRLPAGRYPAPRGSGTAKRPRRTGGGAGTGRTRSRPRGGSTGGPHLVR